MWSSPWITALQACQLSQHFSTCFCFSPPHTPVLPSPPSLCISPHHSWLSLSTPKVNFWWYQMWWVVGSHSSLSWFYDSNPATWAKSPLLFCPVDGIWKHLVSQRREVESKPDTYLSDLVSDKLILCDANQHWNLHDFRDLKFVVSPVTYLLITVKWIYAEWDKQAVWFNCCWDRTQ